MDNKCGLKLQEQGLQSLSDHGTLSGLKSLFLNDMVMANKVSGIQDLCQHFSKSYKLKLSVYHNNTGKQRGLVVCFIF